MRENCCAVIGCPVQCFPWGYDEEDEKCAALKLILLHHISRLTAGGVRRFAVAIDDGVGLYAAETVKHLRAEWSEVAMDCYIPFEGQATKWSPDLRERYFNTLAAADNVYTMHPQETLGCDYEAKMAAISAAAVTIAVCPEQETDKTFAHLLFNLKNMPSMELISVDLSQGPQDK